MSFYSFLLLSQMPESAEVSKLVDELVEDEENKIAFILFNLTLEEMHKLSGVARTYIIHPLSIRAVTQFEDDALKQFIQDNPGKYIEINRDRGTEELDPNPSRKLNKTLIGKEKSSVQLPNALPKQTVDILKNTAFKSFYEQYWNTVNPLPKTSIKNEKLLPTESNKVQPNNTTTSMQIGSQGFMPESTLTLENVLQQVFTHVKTYITKLIQTGDALQGKNILLGIQDVLSKLSKSDLENFLKIFEIYYNEKISEPTETIFKNFPEFSSLIMNNILPDAIHQNLQLKASQRTQSETLPPTTMEQIASLTATLKTAQSNASPAPQNTMSLGNTFENIFAELNNHAMKITSGTLENTLTHKKNIQNILDNLSTDDLVNFIPLFKPYFDGKISENPNSPFKIIPDLADSLYNNIVVNGVNDCLNRYNELRSRKNKRPLEVQDNQKKDVVINEILQLLYPVKRGEVNDENIFSSIKVKIDTIKDKSFLTELPALLAQEYKNRKWNNSFLLKVIQEHIPEYIKSPAVFEEDISSIEEQIAIMMSMLPENFHSSLGKKLTELRTKAKQNNVKPEIFSKAAEELKNALSEDNPKEQKILDIITKMENLQIVPMPPLEGLKKIKLDLNPPLPPSQSSSASTTQSKPAQKETLPGKNRIRVAFYDPSDWGKPDMHLTYLLQEIPKDVYQKIAAFLSTDFISSELYELCFSKKAKDVSIIAGLSHPLGIIELDIIEKDYEAYFAKACYRQPWKEQNLNPDDQDDIFHLRGFTETVKEKQAHAKTTTIQNYAKNPIPMAAESTPIQLNVIFINFHAPILHGIARFLLKLCRPGEHCLLIYPEKKDSAPRKELNDICNQQNLEFHVILSDSRTTKVGILQKFYMGDYIDVLQYSQVSISQTDFTIIKQKLERAKTHHDYFQMSDSLSNFNKYAYALINVENLQSNQLIQSFLLAIFDMTDSDRNDTKLKEFIHLVEQCNINNWLYESDVSYLLLNDAYNVLYNQISQFLMYKNALLIAPSILYPYYLHLKQYYTSAQQHTNALVNAQSSKLPETTKKIRVFIVAENTLLPEKGIGGFQITAYPEVDIVIPLGELNNFVKSIGTCLHQMQHFLAQATPLITRTSNPYDCINGVYEGELLHTAYVNWVNNFKNPRYIQKWEKISENRNTLNEQSTLFQKIPNAKPKEAPLGNEKGKQKITIE